MFKCSIYILKKNATKAFKTLKFEKINKYYMYIYVHLEHYIK